MSIHEHMNAGIVSVAFATLSTFFDQAMAIGWRIGIPIVVAFGSGAAYTLGRVLVERTVGKKSGASFEAEREDDEH